MTAPGVPPRGSILDRLLAVRVEGAINFLLLLLYPAAWLAPLARAGILPFFSGNEVTIAGGIVDLWEGDVALAVLVALFAVVVPYAKTLALSAIHLGYLRGAALPLIEIVGKLSMADVFLIALYIVVVKGVGIGHVTTAWGLWLFTLCVLVSIWISWRTSKHLKQEAASSPPS